MNVILAGGPFDGQMVTIAGEPEEINFPLAAPVWNPDVMDNPPMVPGKHVYRRGVTRPGPIRRARQGLYIYSHTQEDRYV